MGDQDRLDEEMEETLEFAREAGNAPQTEHVGTPRVNVEVGERVLYRLDRPRVVPLTRQALKTPVFVEVEGAALIAAATLIATVITAVGAWWKESRAVRREHLEDHWNLYDRMLPVVRSMNGEDAKALMERINPEGPTFPILLCDLVLFVWYARQSMAVMERKPNKKSNPFKFKWLRRKMGAPEFGVFMATTTALPIFVRLRRHLVHVRVAGWVDGMNDSAAFRLMGKRILPPSRFLSVHDPTEAILAELDNCAPEVGAEVRNRVRIGSCSSPTPVIYNFFYGNTIENLYCSSSAASSSMSAAPSAASTASSSAASTSSSAPSTASNASSSSPLTSSSAPSAPEVGSLADFLGFSKGH